MDTKKWTLWLAMMGILMATAFANDPADGGNEIQNGRNDRMLSKIAPVIEKQRAKLDGVMSTEDLKKVAALKDDLKEQQLMLHGLHCEAGAARIQGEDPDQSLYQEIKAQLIVIGNIYEEAEALANKYEEAIDGLMQGVRTELHAMRNGDQDGRSVMRPGDRRGVGGRPSPDGMFSRRSPEVRFLLWDGGHI